LLLVAAALTAAHATPQLDRLPPSSGWSSDEDPPRLTPPEERPPETPPPDWEAGGVQIPTWVPMVINAAFLVLFAAILMIVLWEVVGRLLRRRDAPEQVAAGHGRPAEREVLDAVDAGLADLSDLDGDPRRAVIACWLRLEEAARAAGVPRRAGDTSTDLVTRLLADRVLSAEVLTAFAEVYRAARFATHTVDERMRDQALAALRRLRAELTTPVAR
jgi:hypothetical protein